MEAKEIVAREVARQAEFGYEPSWEDFVVAGQKAGMETGNQKAYEIGEEVGKVIGVAEGIREVVEWIEGNSVTPIGEDAYGYYIWKSTLGAKLKEWGL